MQKNHYPHAKVGERIKRIRTRLTDLSALGFAQAFEFNYPAYHSWERGRRLIMPEQATKIVSAFGVTLDYIYIGELRPISYKILNSLDVEVTPSLDPDDEALLLFSQLRPGTRQFMLLTMRAQLAENGGV